MDMAAYKNATRRTIGKHFRIGKRMSQATSSTAKIGPKSVDLAVDEKRFRDIVVRDERARSQMEHLATVLVLSESRPVMWPKVGGTSERTELFAAWVSMCVGEVFGESSRAGMFDCEIPTFEEPNQPTCYEIWEATDKTLIRLHIVAREQSCPIW